MREQMKNESKNGWNRWNLGQNSRWNINLSLKINFGRWIAILPLEWHLGRRIKTDVIWAVISRCMKEGKYRQKIDDLSPIYRLYLATRGEFFKKSSIYRRYFGNICGNIFPPIFLHEISCRPLPIHDISTIYHRYIPIFSSLLVGSL